MSADRKRVLKIKVLIGVEIVCLILIAWPAIVSLNWPGVENYGLLGLIFLGMPALLVQLLCMALALFLIGRLDEEEHEKGPLQWGAFVPFAIAVWLSGWAVLDARVL